MQKKEILENSVQLVRKEKGVTQVQLAEAVGVTRQTIISIEKGNYVPSVLLAMKIAKHFNLKIESLFTIK
jgi:putative transcriptional regulator